jgi:hypothetical protein
LASDFKKGNESFLEIKTVLETILKTTYVLVYERTLVSLLRSFLIGEFSVVLENLLRIISGA